MATDYLRTLLERIIGTLGALTRIDDTIRSALTSRLDSIRTAVDSVSNRIREALSTGLSGVVNSITNTVNRLYAVLESIRNVIATAMNNIRNSLMDLVAGIRSAIADVVLFLRNNLGGLIANFVNAVSAIVQGVVDYIRSLMQRWGEFLDDTSRRIGEFLDRKATEIRNRVEDIYQKIVAFLRSLWERIEQAYNQVKEKVIQGFTTIQKFLRENFGVYLDDTASGFENRANAVAQIGWGLMANDGGAIASGINALMATGKRTDLSRFVILAIAVSSLFQGVLASYAAGSLEALRVASISNNPVLPVSIGDTIGAVFKGVMNLQEFYANALKQGVSADVAGKVLEGNRPTLSVGMVTDAYLRGLIGDSDFNRYLSEIGYTQDKIGVIKSLRYVLPSPSDLIRFAVREVFTPEIAQKFGLYEDYPPEFTKYASMIGISEEWAKRYWASHWDLPSATQGFEMFHRGIITYDELKMLLRALDVMPYWRDKLIQLSYNPVTRVDIRRMYSIGVIDENDVYRRYLALGYSPEDAQMLTQFTISEYSPDEETETDKKRKIARSIYEKAYRKHIITRYELLRYYRELGYDEEDAEFMASVLDAEMDILGEDEVFSGYYKEIQKMITRAYERRVLSQQDARTMLIRTGMTEDEADVNLQVSDIGLYYTDKDNIIRGVKNRFLLGLWDTTKVREALSVHGLLPSEIDNLLATWEYEQFAREDRIPSESFLRNAVKRGLLTVDQYYRLLRASGYPDEMARLFVDYYFGGGK